MDINNLKKEMVKHTTDALIEDLQKLNVPKDFKDAHAYNLIQYAFSLMVASAMLLMKLIINYTNSLRRLRITFLKKWLINN